MAQSDPHSSPIAIRAQSHGIALQSAQVAGGAGVAGYIFGATAGLVRNARSPILFGAVASLQWAALGGTFWGIRSALLAAWQPPPHAGPVIITTSRDAVTASGLAGGLSGGLLGLVTRGPRNALPGALMFSLFGGVGQLAANAVSARMDAREEEARAAAAAGGEESGGVLKWMARQKWSPLSELSNDEYGRILDEKILKLDVEIALVNDHLAKMKAEMLREQEQQRQAAASSAAEGRP